MVRAHAMPQQATASTLPKAVRGQQRVTRWFYINIAVLMLLLNVVAFGPSIIDPIERRVPLPLSPLVTVHAIVSALWLLLFLTQATLIATGRTAVHRRLGMIGVVLAVVFVVLGVFNVIEQARRGFDLSGDIGRLPLPPGVTPLAATLALIFFFLEFAILVGAAFCYRHHPSVHKRLMLLAVLGGLTPTPVAHIIGHWLSSQPWALLIFPVSFVAFTSLSAIYDRVSEGRIHPVSLWVPIPWLALRVVEVRVVQPSAMGQEFAAWLIR
jgi:uncharacterized membrane protein YozB (DUF420 family)